MTSAIDLNLDLILIILEEIPLESFLPTSSFVRFRTQLERIIINDVVFVNVLI